MTIQKDCFAYVKDGKEGCGALNQFICKTSDKCPFYKTSKQLSKERKKAEKRIYAMSKEV